MPIFNNALPCKRKQNQTKLCVHTLRCSRRSVHMFSVNKSMRACKHEGENTEHTIQCKHCAERMRQLYILQITCRFASIFESKGSKMIRKLQQQQIIRFQCDSRPIIKRQNRKKSSISNPEVWIHLDILNFQMKLDGLY